ELCAPTGGWSRSDTRVVRFAPIRLNQWIMAAALWCGRMYGGRIFRSHCALHGNLFHDSWSASGVSSSLGKLAYGRRFRSGTHRIWFCYRKEVWWLEVLPPGSKLQQRRDPENPSNRLAIPSPTARCRISIALFTNGCALEL